MTILERLSNQRPDMMPSVKKGNFYGRNLTLIWRIYRL